MNTILNEHEWEMWRRHKAQFYITPRSPRRLVFTLMRLGVVTEPTYSDAFWKICPRN